MLHSLLRPTGRAGRLRAVAWCLLALALQLLGTGGMARMAFAGNGEFVPALCTSHGVAPADTSLPGSTQVEGHDCCAACGIGGSPLLSSTGDAVPPAPTFSLPARPTASPALRAPRAGAMPPRGPPRAA